jgi:hypothetical protein
VSHGGREYVAAERAGHRIVAWTDGPAVLGLVSALGQEALLECVDHLRAEREALRAL